MIKRLTVFTVLLIFAVLLTAGAVTTGQDPFLTERSSGPGMGRAMSGPDFSRLNIPARPDFPFAPQANTGTSRRIITGSALPATCNPNTGDIYFKTGVNNGPYYCSATNVWTRFDTGTTTFTPSWFDVKMYGAKGNGVDNDTLAIQAAIDAAIPVHGVVFFPPGTYLFSSLDLRNIHPVSNADAFGLMVIGSGMGTRLVHAGLVNPAINLNHGSNDLQVFLSDFQLYGPSIVGMVGIDVGLMNRYSVFRNIRIYGFQHGIKFNKALQNLTFYNVCIRGSGRSGLVSEVTSSNIEFNWFGGIVDNCGISGIGGGPYYPAILMYNWAVADLWGVTFEGNWAGGVYLEFSINVTFHGCRFEETVPSNLAPRYGIWIESNATGTMFRDSYFAYDSTLSHMFYVNSSEVMVADSLIEDSSAASAELFVVGATPQLMFRDVGLIGCITSLARKTGIRSTLFVNLGTPADGSVIYCSDCTIASPCAAKGAGALAKRLAGAWICN